MKLSTEASSNLQGIAYVVSRMDWYWNLSDLLLDENLSEARLQGSIQELEKAITQLYSKLLQHQMKSICYYNMSNSKRWVQDLLALEGWDGCLDNIKDAEATVQSDTNLYNTVAIRNHLDETSKKADWQNEKLDSFESAILNCLSGTRINYQQLESWMKHCDEKHAGCRRWDSSRDDLSLDGFRLLDVRTGDVVPAAGQTIRYAALSYVWGPPPPEVPISNAEQNHSFPKTIEDAMEVSKELGLDFLWVDRYCIPQHDEEQKKHQIKNMHCIYRQAHFTIVAVAGNGPDHGLPGVSSPRVLAPHSLIDNHLFVGNAGDSLAEANARINKSLWNSRAWTYQEKVFSRRIIYFTEAEMVFHCKSDSHGVDDPAHNYFYPESRPLVGPIKKRGPTTPEAIVLRQAFNELIREFNRRQITYEADRVDAIAGVLSDMKNRGEIHGHVTGVLVFREYPNSLDGFFGLGYSATETKSWDSGFFDRSMLDHSAMQGSTGRIPVMVLGGLE
jgi:hypothetical protein